MITTDPYNAAVSYLIDIYGCQEKNSESFDKRLRQASNIKNRKEIEATKTDKDIVRILPRLTEFKSRTDNAIYLLLGQYYYGSAPKQELHDIMLDLGKI